MNNEPPVDAADPRWLMSAMADGEADADELARACAAWASGDAPARGRWHAYHLIGDVLRSEDLASAPRRDQAFLERLRARLEDEPAVLAPQPMPAAAPARRPAWAMPAAMAAGLMALATGLAVSLSPGGGDVQRPALAAAPAAPTVVVAEAASAAAPATPLAIAVTEPAAAGGRLVRDAELDRYLRAHRDYATALPGSLPGGSGRSIATVSFER